MTAKPTAKSKIGPKANIKSRIVESMHNALMAIHRAESIADIETDVFKELKAAFDLTWIRIFLHSSAAIDEQLERLQGLQLFRQELVNRSRHLGKIVFARQSQRPFKKTEHEALLQISESVAFALDRLAKIDQAENLKQQWESTFDAISEPLCLTDENFAILRTNKAFLTVSGYKASQPIGMNCFAAFCGAGGTKNLKPEGGRFILEQKSSDGEIRQFDVSTQRITQSDNAPAILLILFRDITEQKKIEKRIFESAKMAELGTIGSSIAHDINNPLGGMLSFLQLIKMDLPIEHPMRADILEMEAAGHRCKEIVENLLRFSRRQDADSAEVIDLKAVVRQAIKIIELQTRSLGIELDVLAPAGEIQFLGQFNLLSQALSQLLQNAYVAVEQRLSQKPGETGRIRVEIQKQDRRIEIQINDNGVGISAEHQTKILNPLMLLEKSTGLTLAYQIVDQHGGQLEIISQPNVGTTVKMTFLNV